MERHEAQAEVNRLLVLLLAAVIVGSAGFAIWQKIRNEEARRATQDEQSAALMRELKRVEPYLEEATAR